MCPSCQLTRGCQGLEYRSVALCPLASGTYLPILTMLIYGTLCCAHAQLSSPLPCDISLIVVHLKFTLDGMVWPEELRPVYKVTHVLTWIDLLILSQFTLYLFQMDPTFVLIIIFSGRVWDAITDPVVGFLTSHTRTRFGRLRPW